MSHILDFLHARLDEDEAIARGTGSEVDISWRFEAVDTGEPPGGVVRDGEDSLLWMPGIAHRVVADHIALHDPARVLAEVAAKRRLLTDLTLSDSDRHTLVRLLSAGYADHPAYRKHWRL